MDNHQANAERVADRKHLGEYARGVKEGLWTRLKDNMTPDKAQTIADLFSNLATEMEFNIDLKGRERTDKVCDYIEYTDVEIDHLWRQIRKEMFP